MARAKSIVLTPAEKRSAIKVLKGDIKLASTDAKVAAKAVGSAEKAHIANLKTLTKVEAIAAKNVAKLNAQLEALTAE